MKKKISEIKLIKFKILRSEAIELLFATLKRKSKFFPNTHTFLVFYFNFATNKNRSLITRNSSNQTNKKNKRKVKFLFIFLHALKLC